MTPSILWFASCSVACLFGFIVGRCFRDFEGITLTQDLMISESEKAGLIQALADRQAELDKLAARYHEGASDVA
jgi:hypothetical protein